MRPPTHTPTGKRYKWRGFNPKAQGLEGLEWDSAELYMVGREGERDYRQVIMVTMTALNSERHPPEDRDIVGASSLTDLITKCII